MSAEVPRSSSCCWMMLQYLQRTSTVPTCICMLLTFPAFAFDGFSSDMTRSMVAMYDVSLAESARQMWIKINCALNVKLKVHWETTSCARKRIIIPWPLSQADLSGKLGYEDFKNLWGDLALCKVHVHFDREIDTAGCLVVFVCCFMFL